MKERGRIYDLSVGVQVTGLQGWDIQAIVLRQERRRDCFRVRGPVWRRHEYLSLRELKQNLGPDRLARLDV